MEDRPSQHQSEIQNFYHTVKHRYLYMRVSVVVCTYSSERYGDLMELLESINSQTYENIEIVIVVDGNPEIYQRIRSLERDDMKILLNKKNMGNNYSRNLGVKHATGDIVAFIDDDAIAEKNWVSNIVETFTEDKDIGVVTGDIIPKWIDDSMKWFPKDLHWIISCSYSEMPTTKQEVRNGFGCNLSFKKEIFEQIGLFDAKLGKIGDSWTAGEEADLCSKVLKKANKKVIFNPEVRVKHKVYPYRIEIKNVLRRAFVEGYSKALLNNQYRSELSTEFSYIKKLLFGFYPRAFAKLFVKPSIIMKQIFVVTMVIISVASGWLWFNMKRMKIE